MKDNERIDWLVKRIEENKSIDPSETGLWGIVMQLMQVVVNQYNELDNIRWELSRKQDGDCGPY